MLIWILAAFGAVVTVMVGVFSVKIARAKAGTIKIEFKLLALWSAKVEGMFK